jgi:predicted metal-dependent hydrolase
VTGGRGDVPEPVLDPEERLAFAKGVDEFNRGFFFECHDTLEDLWRGVRGPSRDFFQGLIQVSVAFYHLTGGNRAGAESLLRRALSRLAKYPASYWGFRLDAHRDELRRWQASLAVGDTVPLDLAALPRWRFAWLDANGDRSSD